MVLLSILINILIIALILWVVFGNPRSGVYLVISILNGLSAVTECFIPEKGIWIMLDIIFMLLWGFLYKVKKLQEDEQDSIDSE